MSCFFCKSNYHISSYCDVYESNESREKAVSDAKCCPNCFAHVNLYCARCRFNKYCFICFSRKHSSIFCPDGLQAPNIFPPKIDSVLLFRFGQLLAFEEKWSISHSYPYMFKTIKLKPLKIRFENSCNIWSSQYYEDLDLVVAEKSTNFKYYTYYNESFLLKAPIFHIKTLDINRLNISSQEFLLLLSSKTTHLKCSSIKFVEPELSFREILIRAAKLEDIDIFETDIKVDDSWPDDVLQLNKADILRNIHLTIPDLNFSTQSLKNLLKATSVKIHLFITLSSFEDMQNIITTSRDILSQHFIQLQQCYSNYAKTRIEFSYQLGKLGSWYYDCYTLPEN